MTIPTLVWAYLISIVGGHFISWSVVTLARRGVGSTVQSVWWLTLLLGGVERAIITTMIIWTPNLAAAFMGGWTALKVAAGWGRVQGHTVDIRAGHFIALIGTALSFAVAIAAGLLAHPESLAALAGKAN